MTTNPALGLLLHAIGGFAAGSFYAPLKKVERWAWESFWLIMGLAAWLGAPWIVALITIPDLLNVLANSPGRAWGLCLLFGVLWGLGNLTFGLSVRYLGMALGYAVALGFEFAVDGKAIGKHIDFYDPKVTTTGEISLGTVQLDKGTHVLTATAIGHNEKA